MLLFRYFYGRNRKRRQDHTTCSMFVFSGFGPLRAQAWGGLSTSSRGRNQAFWSSTEGPLPAGAVGSPPATEFWSAGPNTPVLGCGPQYLSDCAAITSSGTILGRTWSSTFLSYVDTCTSLLQHGKKIKKRNIQYTYTCQPDTRKPGGIISSASVPISILRTVLFRVHPKNRGTLVNWVNSREEPSGTRLNNPDMDKGRTHVYGSTVRLRHKDLDTLDGSLNLPAVIKSARVFQSSGLSIEYGPKLICSSNRCY